MSETSIGALTGLRELTQLIPEYTGDLVSSSFADYKGWISSTTNPILSYETYYDLSGYTIDELTGMPIAAIVQDPGIYACGSNTRAQLHILDILSQERLDRNEVYNLVLNNNVPGMALSENNFNQITFGNHRLMLAQGTFADPTGLAVFLPASQTQFGSGDAVVTEKLWVYRFVVAPGITDITSVRVPASRFLLQMNIVKESDNVYLQRLRRSYEDAQ